MSHVEAQYAGLVSLLQSGCVKHIAGIRIVDDTNAWVAPQQQATIEAAFHPEDLVDDGSDPHLCQAKKTSSNSGKQGKRKVCQVLGLIERLVIRKDRDLDIVQLHAPAQVLPKANAGTLLHRVGKWSMLSQVRGEHVCGDEAREMLGRAKIKMYVTCTDSLTANLSVAGMEQSRFQTRGTDGSISCQAFSFCMHHQGCLAKKPIILAAEGLATNLVRMAHASKTTLFRSRLANSLDALARQAVRMEVVEVPLSAKVDQNRAVLNLCSSDLQNSDGQELILSMLNNDWGCPLNNGSLLHFCKPNCCKTKEDFQFKMRQALEVAFGNIFETPLLYRWKHIDSALAYVIRGLSIHSLELLHGQGPR